ncbi:tetratricopeptide repeat protein [Desulfomarina sp.]
MRSYKNSSLISCYIIVFCLVFFLSVVDVFSAPEVRGLKSRARKYYQGIGVKQDYAKAFALYRRAAEKGDAGARYICGGMYFRGLGVKKDSRAAFRYLYSAALQGKSSGRSERILAEAFFQGNVTLKNYSEAIHWYSLSAEHGDSEAQNTLGYLYFTGRGVDRNEEKGAAYFLQAARNNHPQAQFNVGIMYLTGSGIGEIDLVTAYGWMNIAAANGYRSAVAARDYLETLLSGKELSEAQQLAGTLRKKMMGREKNR